MSRPISTFTPLSKGAPIKKSPLGIRVYQADEDAINEYWERFERACAAVGQPKTPYGKQEFLRRLIHKMVNQEIRPKLQAGVNPND